MLDKGCARNVSRQATLYWDVSLSASTITRRVEDIGEHLHETLKESSKFFKYFSLSIHENSDTTDTVQLLIFIRGIDAKFRRVMLSL